MTENLERRHLCNAFSSVEPAEALPLIFDSPHSGTNFPESFLCAATAWQLKTTVDAHVDELFRHVVDQGAAFLEALFPRTFVDPNRSEHEIDPALLDGPWPHTVRETRKTKAGNGVIRRTIAGVRMYDRLLPVEDALWRLRCFHAPYHDALAALLERAFRRYGAVWHVNCHSMKSVGPANKFNPAAQRPDFVIGDLDGTTADPAFTALLADLLRERGYSVWINTPFRGAEIVYRYGDPARDRHSIQIEVNRALYLDEKTYEKSAGFKFLRQDLMVATRGMADYVLEKVRLS